MAYFLAFAASSVTISYVTVEYYAWMFGEFVQAMFRLSAISLAVMLMLVPFVRPQARRRHRWAYAAFGLALFLAAELARRLVMKDLAWDFLKDLGIVLDVSTPALLALGAAALVREWRRPDDVAPSPQHSPRAS